MSYYETRYDFTSYGTVVWTPENGWIDEDMRTTDATEEMEDEA